MDKDIKIGISRNRLFDFQNVVSLVAEQKDDFDEKELSKAIRMLSVKEPLITSVIELDENSEAFIQLERVTPEIVFSEADTEKFLADKKAAGINFSKRLFEFYVLNKKSLVILSHTVVSDVKSLLLLAEELLSYYNKESVSVEPQAIKLFSDDNELPGEIQSFVAERVTEVLENDWLMKPVHFDKSDLNNARAEFFKINGELKSSEYCFSDELTERLISRCEELKIDFSSCVAFAFLKALSETVKSSKKTCRANMQLDRRPYFVDYKTYSVGAFNGTVSVDLPENKKSLAEQVKAFHENYYKKFTVCFNAFYNEFFLSRLSPCFIDSTYMYKVNRCKNKSTKKLATLYGCEQQFLMGFTSVNLKQKSWENLSTFHHICVKEPHKSNENISLSLIMGEKNVLFMELFSTKFKGGNIDEILNRFEAILNQL